MISPSRLSFALVGMGFLAAGCAGTSHPPKSVTTTTSAPTSVLRSSPPVEPPETGRAHALVVEASGCWLGGLWSDALEETGEARDAGITRRCNDVLHTVGMSKETGYYPLRAVDEATVGQIAQRVRDLAAIDKRDAPHAAELVVLLEHVANASREAVRARRAADNVKESYDALTSADERHPVKVAAAPALRESRALGELLTYKGPYEVDTRTIGLLLAIDRMEIARGLPKHLKVFTVEGPLSDIFGVAPPELGGDAAKPIPTGTWLTYLTRVADAAGHPVPSEARNPQNREPLAWNGTLEGLADRLRGLHGDPTLTRIAHHVIVRIDAHAAGDRTIFLAHDPQDR